MIFSSLLLSNCSVTPSSKEGSARQPAGIFQDFYGAGESGLTPAQEVGKEIWYKATAGNKRYHMYTLPQRISFQQMKWWSFLGAQAPDGTSLRERRFTEWGLMNDPTCCAPGKDCQERFNIDVTLEDTFGFDYCQGDEKFIWPAIGKKDFHDPACDLQDVGDSKSKDDPCGLEFGAAAGVIGIRKFPNPRFDRSQWELLKKSAQASGRLYPWDEIALRLSQGSDASIEMPYLFGMSCVFCHASFNPENPPADVNHPQWQNLKGLVGNQYLRASEIMGSGFNQHSLQWQTQAESRPGTVDTSAIANDFIFNPGSMNPIINFKQRPVRTDQVLTAKKIHACPVNADVASCWCNPKTGVCWQAPEKSEAAQVPHLLKGGEDSVGYTLAVQRVYLNEGMCAETCWVNHLADALQIDPDARNYRQTPFDLMQCRRDCQNFRALEDRVDQVVDFLTTQKPLELAVALGLNSRQSLVAKIENNEVPAPVLDEQGQVQPFQKGDVVQGQKVFEVTCSRCHSSQNPLGGKYSSFTAEDSDAIRQDWLGNDGDTTVEEVGTFTCRALHSNHNPGQIWAQFASETVKERGPGFYRNVSLLSAWAFAPFLHNNSVGPEICGSPTDRFYHSPYVEPGGPQCRPFPVAVNERLSVFAESLHDLFNPGLRKAKRQITDREIILPILPSLLSEIQPSGLLQPILSDLIRDAKLHGFYLVLPKGVSSAKLGSFRYKEFTNDWLRFIQGLSVIGENRSHGYFQKKGASGEQLYQAFRTSWREVSTSQKRYLKLPLERLNLFLDNYSNCAALAQNNAVENAGHEFGAGLSSQAKRQLQAFLLTL